MKNSLKRILSLSMVLFLILSTAAVFSGCYMIESEKMSKVEGTYELTSYSGQENYMEQREMKLYVVIRADGTGYYAYKDKDKEPHIAELKCSFEADLEEGGKYSYIHLDFGNGETPTKLGIKAAGLFKISTKLNVTTLKWKDVSDLSQGTYSVNVTFTRVSKATDLSYVYEQFGKYDTIPYGIISCDGLYEISSLYNKTTGSYSTATNYVYSYLDLDIINRIAKVWVMTESYPVQREFSFDLEYELQDGVWVFFINEVPFHAEKTFGSGYVRLLTEIDPETDEIYSFCGDWIHEDILEQVNAKYQAYLENQGR